MYFEYSLAASVWQQCMFKICGPTTPIEITGGFEGLNGATKGGKCLGVVDVRTDGKVEHTKEDIYGVKMDKSTFLLVFRWFSTSVSYVGCPTIFMSAGCGNLSTIFSNVDGMLFCFVPDKK